MKKTICLAFQILLCVYLSAQPNCNLKRYIDDIFTVQTTIEPAVYATAPAITPTYVSESVTYMQDLSFNFYEPMGDTLSERPLIIMAHGGAFLVGSKDQAQVVAYCEALAKKGFCVASIDYRLNFDIFSSPSSVRAVYRGLQDFKAAVRYFRNTASVYKIDPDKVFAAGNSAGGISALHASYVDDADRTSTSVFAPTFNAPDLGCVDCSGNTLTENSEPNGVVNLWGGMGDVNWIEATEAPVISFHGLNDTTVSPNTASPFGYPVFPPLSGSIPIHNRANSIGLINELNTYPGQGHDLWNNATLADEIVVKSAAFLNTLLRDTPVLLANLTGCVNSSDVYCVQNPNPSSNYCWSVTGGLITANNNACITIDWGAAGTGIIELTEFNQLDARSETIMENVIIETLPIANFTYTSSGTTVDFTNTSVGGNNYLWIFGDGNESTQISPIHTFVNPGTYSVVLEATSLAKCTGVIMMSITVPETQNCDQNITITLDPTPTDTYQAIDWVQSDKIIDISSDVIFKAGDYIELNAGFEVPVGSVFLAEIEICPN